MGLTRRNLLRLAASGLASAVAQGDSGLAFSFSTALEPQAGICRRDPSDVVKVGSTYYVWYTKSLEGQRDYPTGYPGTVWYAISPDGKTWTERGQALGRGGRGAWDEHGVFTPNIMEAAGRFFLYFTAVPEPFSNDFQTGATPTAIGVALADSPDGPWKQFEGNPVLRPAKRGEWDDLRVDDSCLVERSGKYWLFYKGVATWRRHLTPMGVAISDKPTGPFVRSASNPLIDAGHEVAVWPDGEGISALVAYDGIWHSRNGLVFARRLRLTGVPAAAATYPPSFRQGRAPWGLCHARTNDGLVYLRRFECAGFSPQEGKMDTRG